ncbi:MAG: hypothetical protein V7L26_14805 [Nostoc sp.]|uniref:TRAFAC clade GTPase domain-containing protein n=1 Tax=Nostoc sp. TaxID=1180 RepID=UPI002FF27C54
MSELIKIIMLGGQGSGKTCYMLAMYAAMQMGKHGFTITTINQDESVRLNELWERLVRTQGRDRWPSGTNQIHNYTFEFTEGLDSKIRFDWLDYRGDAMSEAATSDEITELRNQILQSSGLFLCISGEYLRETITDSNLAEVIVKTKARFMTDYMIRYGSNIRRQERQYFPIIITISKYDLCGHRPHLELIEDIKHIFSPLFTSESYWYLMVCPVTLGRDLANNKDRGGIFPQNIHFPLIFALYCKLGQMGKSERAILQENEEILEDLLDRNSFMRWIQRNKITELQNEIDRNKASLIKINNLMRRIVKELSDTNAKIYHSGLEVDFSIQNKS